MDRDEREEFMSKLDRWKSEGCSILVVGEALDLLRQTSKLLLGGPDRSRYRAFVVTDAESSSVHERLPDRPQASMRTQTKIIDYESIPRSATTETPTELASIPKMPVYGGIDRLYDEITETAESFEFQNDQLPPGAFRLSFDTLRPLLAEYDCETVERWLMHTGNLTKRYRGMGHYLLPQPYSSETVQQLQDTFEAVIQVRASSGTDAKRKERWHVPDADITTPWRLVDDDSERLM